MKRFLKWFCLLLSVCILFSACSEEERIFYYHIRSIPKNLDPQVASTPEELSVVSGLFDGLFSMDANGNPVLQAAESYEISASGLVYTIYLKQDLFYRAQGSASSAISSPIPVTAHDYVFAMQRVFMPSTHSPHITTLSAIKNASLVLNGADPSNLGVVALDDYTLQITLSYPDSSFLEALTCAGAMPCNRDFFESTGGSYGLSREMLICNGPYNLRTWNAYDGVTLVAVDENAPVARIRLPLLGNGTSTLDLLLNEETDACILPYSERTQTLSGYRSTELNITTWVLVFNPNSTGLNNRQIRNALGGTAQTALAGTTLPGGFYPADGLIPQSVHINGVSYRESAGAAVSNVSLSRMPEIYTSGLNAENLAKLSNIRFFIPQEFTAPDIMDEVNQSWQRDLSAFFSVERMSTADILTAINRGDFDIALIPVSAFSNDIYALLLPYAENGSFAWVGASNPAFAQSLEPLSYTIHSREPLYLQAEKALLSDYVICPLLFESSSFITSKWVKEVYVSPFGPLLDFHSLAV